ncbi:hypothetical protein AB1Y20_006490 [Prymnesium parvum]|uniref:F-box domain-containing protein n=1 Tax=Prymnesium parvum TaxID=97485 RepID=A0AB34IY44_PRYPA
MPVQPTHALILAPLPSTRSAFSTVSTGHAKLMPPQMASEAHAPSATAGRLPEDATPAPCMCSETLPRSASSSVETVFGLRDLIESILAWLTPSELLSIAHVSSAFCVASEELLTRDGVLELAGGDSSDAVTDELLLFLARQRMPHSLRKLDVTGCGSLTKRAIWKAARASPCLRELIATKVGGASWTLVEVQRLIDACPSLRSLHVDCKAQGITSELCDLMQHPAAAVEKLVVHQLKRDAMSAQHHPAEDAESSGDSWSSFGRALQRCPSLRELDAGGNCLEAVDGVQQISRALESKSLNLTCLKMPSVPSMRRDIGLLAESLSHNSKLEDLELGCNFIGAAGAQQLAAALEGHPTLRRLELPHNPLLDGAVALGEALVHNRSLTKLAMPFTGLNDDACDALSRALSGGSIVATLDLSGNRITAVGVALLAQGLCGSARLGQASSPVTPRRGQAASGTSMPSGVKVNRTLTSLNLTANHAIGAEGALAISSALPHCDLRFLSLAGCCTGASPCGRLMSSLRRSSVECLDLSSNEIGDEGTWDLAWGLAGSPVRDLRLAVNSIEDDGAAELLVALNSSLGLQSLDLRGNNIDVHSDVGLELAVRPGVNLNFQNAPRK